MKEPHFQLFLPLPLQNQSSFMSLSLTFTQFPQPQFEEVVVLVETILDKQDEGASPEEVQSYLKALSEKCRMVSLLTLQLDFHTYSNLQMLLTGNKDCLKKYDWKNTAQLPFYGSTNFDFHLTNASYGAISIDDVCKVNMYFKSLQLDSKADFELYYNDLPEDLKLQLYIPPSNFGKNEFLDKALNEFLNFFYKCEENNAAIFIECY